MKKILSTVLVLMMCVAMPLTVLAEASASKDLIVSAQVVAQAETAVKAPASGELAPFTVREGDAVKKGDTLFTIEPKSVYADIDGTIATVYARSGDIADAAVSRFGSVLAIERVDRTEIQGNVRTGYNSTENRTLYVGTPVYLRSANEKHFADGMITAVNGNSFTVSVIGGDLVFTQDVKIYREASYDSKTLLARASLSAIAPYAVSVSGTILSMNVKAGDAVKAGDLLFTYVPDALDPALRGKADATSAKAEQELIITAVNVTQGASVQKGQALCTVSAVGAYQLCAQVEEGDVTRLNVGDTLRAVFEEWQGEAVTVTVASISPLGTNEDTSRYKVYFDFDAPEGVLLGMHATVEK